MKDEIESVRVRFKKEDGDIVAYFPDLNRITHEGVRVATCYAHIGQHGEGTIEYFNRLKDAEPNEYTALLKELKNIGYDVTVLNGIKYRAKKGA